MLDCIDHVSSLQICSSRASEERLLVSGEKPVSKALVILGFWVQFTVHIFWLR
jgi:hypothetical protein